MFEIAPRGEYRTAGSVLSNEKKEFYLSSFDVKDKLYGLPKK